MTSDAAEKSQRVKTILFVCTGNTCRSPMAGAIARDLASKIAPEGVETVIRTAGVSAGPGAPATPEAVRAVESLGHSLDGHRSTPLTAEMLRDADHVYGFTREHVQAALRLDPKAEGKVELLDPARQDVPDPIGGPQPQYDQVARKLREIIEMRLREVFA